MGKAAEESCTPLRKYQKNQGFPVAAPARDRENGNLRQSGETGGDGVWEDEGHCGTLGNGATTETVPQKERVQP